ncbi:HAMP domain-containing sensor histidine kinase [Bdellovibrionota bacterium FG-1]
MSAFWKLSAHEVTLRTTLNRVLLLTLALVTIATIGILFGYAEIKQTTAIRERIDELAKGTPAQIAAVLPSFLVPEQRLGMAIMLERFKASDGLDDITVLLPGSPLPAALSACTLGSAPSDCVEVGGKRIAYVAPVREGDHTFGYLVKTKIYSNPFAGDVILHMIESASVVLVLVFLGLFLFSSRLTARMIPDELSNLATWVESVLSDQTSAKAPRLRFKELNDLAAQIAQILERHERARDQAVVGQLTSGIMHDIRTPMAPIVAAHLLVAEQTEGSEKRLKRLENLFRACTTNLPIIGNLIESVLDGSREISVESQALDLRETIRQAVQLLSPRALNRSVELNVHLGDTPIVVPHDPNQMTRVFANVIRNSIDAIVDARSTDSEHQAQFKITVDACADGGAHVRMEDSGLGLPADPEKVFRVFRSSKPRGSGLGLMISRKIVEAHGGKMTAGRSDCLAGARFDVNIPAAAGSLTPGLTRELKQDQKSERAMETTT